MFKKKKRRGFFLRSQREGLMRGIRCHAVLYIFSPVFYVISRTPRPGGLWTLAGLARRCTVRGPHPSSLLPCLLFTPPCGLQREREQAQTERTLRKGRGTWKESVLDN